jgi:glucose/arabinose dehydrogenase
MLTNKKCRSSRALGLERLEARYTPSTLLTGFVEQPVAVGLTRPISMALASDGRIFVAEQDGAIRIVKDGALLPRPFAKLDVNDVSESGLIGIALDPNFSSNHYVYVDYTVSPLSGSGSLHNRISRFQANGDAVVPGSEKVLYELDPQANSYHMGGAMHFGGDGKLYFTTGDNGNSQQVQSLSNTFGKIFRINSDGSIPADNPFYAQAAGKLKAIWAIGFRNPFTFAVQPGSGRIYVNDVGAHAYEEIDSVAQGANYGWPLTEGPTSRAGITSPLFAYPHDSGAIHGDAIAGGAFYNPKIQQFPEKYRGDYFFADYGTGDINVLDTHGTATIFARGTPWTTQTIDLAVDAAGHLYYLMLGDGNPSGGQIMRISVANQPPVVHLSGNREYRENAAELPIAPTATIADADTSIYPGGKLTISISSGREAADRLTVHDNGYVTLNGASVLVGGIAIGTQSGGSGTEPLVISLNTHAYRQRVISLLRNIAFHNLSDNPAATPRTVAVQLSDGQGTVSAVRTATITVQPVNDPPVLSHLGTSLGYQRGAVPLVLAGYALVADPDSADFANGKLTVQIVAGSDDGNRLLIGGAFSMSGGVLRRQGTAIGSIVSNGQGKNRLEVLFNSQATRSVVQELVRVIRFATTPSTSTAQRTIAFTLSDGDGAVSAQVTKKVNVF